MRIWRKKHFFFTNAPLCCHKIIQHTEIKNIIYATILSMILLHLLHHAMNIFRIEWYFVIGGSFEQLVTYALRSTREYFVFITFAQTPLYEVKVLKSIQKNVPPKIDFLHVPRISMITNKQVLEQENVHICMVYVYHHWEQKSITQFLPQYQMKFKSLNKYSRLLDIKLYSREILESQHFHTTLLTSEWLKIKTKHS